MKYICPMHPEIKGNKPGRCPKCKMNLILEKDVSKNSTKNSYMPLIIIITLIVLTSLTISVNNFIDGNFSLLKSLSYFMISFFLVFGGFKLIDLPGFAQGYSTYDLLAQKWYSYGYIYPFLEIFFGLSMILKWHMNIILVLEIMIMIFSGLGVVIKLFKKEKFYCACLGTFLKVPLTNVTLLEDFGMAFLGILLLTLNK